MLVGEHGGNRATTQTRQSLQGHSLMSRAQRASPVRAAQRLSKMAQSTTRSSQGRIHLMPDRSPPTRQNPLATRLDHTSGRVEDGRGSLGPMPARTRSARPCSRRACGRNSRSDWRPRRCHRDGAPSTARSRIGDVRYLSGRFRRETGRCMDGLLRQRLTRAGHLSLRAPNEVFAEIRSNTPQAASCQGLGWLQPVLHQLAIAIIARANSLDGGAR
jgi:hypothetical protein